LTTEPETLGPFDPAKMPREGSDTSFEVELDEERPRRHEPVYVDVVARNDELLPIVPANWRTLENARASIRRIAARWWHIFRWHALRAPWHGLLLLWFAFIGAFRLVGRQLRWWWVSEQDDLRQRAATDNEPEVWSKLTDQARAIRLYRGVVLLGEVVGLVVMLVLLHYAPGWVAVLIVVAAVPVLARAGRPGRRVIGSAVVATRFRKLNSDIVLRAYHAAGLGHPDKPGQKVEFLSTMARDATGQGSQVLVALAHGRTFTEAMNAREKIASGLDVALSQVYLTRDKLSNRSHHLYVSDVDPLSIPAGRSPLLDCKVRDIWTAAPLGLDERGRRVNLPLLFHSVLVGAQPRKGKTFTARSLALFAALDPHVRLSVFDGKGSPDWRKFALVAWSFGFGLLPDRIQGDPLETLVWTLQQIKQDVLRRNVKLSELPTSICPEGKLTRDIARDPRFGMPVWVVILDEFQEFLNSGDDERDLVVADLLVFIVKVGPSVGIIPVDSTQRPSGIGSTGKVAKRFTDFRDNHLTRFALKTGSWQVSDLVLGAGAYSEGYDSSALPNGDGSDGGYDYRGIGILYDSPVGNATVRTFLADGQDAEKILLAARAARERAGTLDGMAAGEAVAQQVRDVLFDTVSVYRAGEAWISWQQLASRLAEQMPEYYADTTKEAISAKVRALGAKEKKGRDGGQSLWGVPRSEVELAMKQREIGAAR